MLTCGILMTPFHSSQGNPYRIRLDTGTEVWGPKDTNLYVRDEQEPVIKHPLRFKVGDEVLANTAAGRKFEPGRIKEVWDVGYAVFFPSANSLSLSTCLLVCLSLPLPLVVCVVCVQLCLSSRTDSRVYTHTPALAHLHTLALLPHTRTRTYTHLGYGCAAKQQGWAPLQDCALQRVRGMVPKRLGRGHCAEVV